MLLLVGSDYIVMFCARFLVTNKIILHMIVFAFIERQDERRDRQPPRNLIDGAKVSSYQQVNAGGPHFMRMESLPPGSRSVGFTISKLQSVVWALNFTLSMSYSLVDPRRSVPEVQMSSL